MISNEMWYSHTTFNRILIFGNMTCFFQSIIMWETNTGWIFGNIKHPRLLNRHTTFFLRSYVNLLNLDEFTGFFEFPVTFQKFRISLRTAFHQYPIFLDGTGTTCKIYLIAFTWFWIYNKIFSELREILKIEKMFFFWQKKPYI